MDQFISLATNLNVQLRTINPDAALAIGLHITQLMSTHSIFMRAVYLQTHNTARRGRIMMSEYFESQLSQK
jgi:hypothetical protein